MGAWTLLQDYIVPSTTTGFTVNNFGTITKDDFIKIVFTHVATTTIDLKFYINNNTTDSNYWHQYFYNDGTNTYSGRRQFPLIHYTPVGNTSLATTYLKLDENDKLAMFTTSNRVISSAVCVDLVYSISTSTFTSGITSITYQGHLSNGIGAGSRIQIYKLTAQKVKDITVASNTTQVDLTDLNITKDSEYLLVSDLNNTPGITAGNAINLFINDNTTATNYYYQVIVGAGSPPGAARENYAIYQLTRDGEKGVSYSHIKLSNIGAYTSQNYVIDRAGSADIQIRNYFVSSTAENITSITKLNIRTGASNGIAAGSRFILYKLY